MGIIKFIQNKLQNKEERRRAEVLKMKKKIILIILVVLIFVYIFLINTIWSKDKIGTRQHRQEAPFCESDDECLLYNCTNCGNKYWVQKNDDTECDKNQSIIIGCECAEGKCKRVINRNQ